MYGLIAQIISAVFAGVAISIGCIANMICESKVLGAFLFSAGLFICLSLQFSLFTGKVQLVIYNKGKNIFPMICIWLGNLLGASLSALLARNTNLISNVDAVNNLLTDKLAKSTKETFLLAMLCGIIIYLAVSIYSVNTDCRSCFGVVLLIPIFILCGFEHCVADMFYVLFTNKLCWQTIKFLLIVTIGNASASILFETFTLLNNKLVIKETLINKSKKDPP